MKKHTIQLQPLGKFIQVNDNTPLIDVLHEFGVEFPCGGKGTCGKCKVKLLEGNIEVNDSQLHMLHSLQLAADNRLACQSQCTSDITLEIEQFNHLILADETEFDVVPQAGFGVAVDVGTTSLVAQLIDLTTTKVVAVETLLNPQSKFGADLISRIEACRNGHAAEMTHLIRQAVGQMIERLLLQQSCVIQRIAMVGNTVMQLIFSNCDVSPLAEYPFNTNDLGSKEFSTEELDWHFDVVESPRFYPSIGSFVGSDILAGIAATSLHLNEQYSLLIDLGTNGELVIGNKHKIVCASTAAGPAFEGTNISMGMRAVTGAISSISFADNMLQTFVIGNGTPKGICGSALVDAIAIFKRNGIIGIFGEITSGEDSVHLVDKVILTQKDIHEFQLAKAAIAAGISILCSTLSIGLSDIHKVYIAGGFGNYITIPHIVEIGMIDMPEDKIRKMGNTALIGAKMFLFSNDETISSILSKTIHINLESDPNFQNIFVDKMLF